MSVTYQTFAKLVLEPSEKSKACTVAITYTMGAGTLNIQCGGNTILLDKEQLSTLAASIYLIFNDLT